MKALITGGAGFIGSHLVEELINRGQEVIALDDFSTGDSANLGNLSNSPGLSVLRGSVLEAGDVAGPIKQADVVYHLAASVGVQHVLERPLETLETNVLGTANVLRLAEQHGNKKVILASSSEVYGKGAKTPFREDDDSVLGPTSVSRWGYACSKAFDEFLALAYHREKGLPVMALRLFNTVGPRQQGRYGMVMPRFVSQALAGDPMTVYGDGEQLRTFTYVKDVVKAMADIAQVPSAEGQVFNVGSDSEISINALAMLVVEVLHSDSEIVHIPFSQVYGENFEEARRKLPDISKIRGYIDYHPTTDVAHIVEEITTDLRKGVTYGKSS